MMKPPAAGIVSLALLSASILLVAVGQQMLSYGRWWYLPFCLAVSVLLVLLYLRVCSSAEPPNAPRLLQLAAFSLVLIVAAIFRLAYLREVPAGYCGEVIHQFLEFSDRLLNHGFEYRPIWGYNSTLHSYLIALSWKLFGESMLVYRGTSAFYSAFIVAVMFFWLKSLFDWRTALVGSFFMAVSYYQMWATRCGYHFYLVPLFIMSLFASVILGLRTQKLRYGLFAALSIVLGIHAHWCYAVTPVALLIYLGQKFLRDRGSFRKNLGWLLVMIIATAILLAPALRYIYRDGGNRSYITSRFSARSFDDPSLGNKYFKNLLFMLFTYSGRKIVSFYFDDGQYVPGIAAAVACLALIGLIYCCARAGRSEGCAILSILFWTHVVALTITKANNIYSFHLLLYIYSFAAVCVCLIWREVRGLLPRRIGGYVSGLAVCLFLSFMAARNFNHFFYERIFFNNLLGPDTAQGRAFIVAERMGAFPGAAIFLPRDEPGKNFGDELFDFSRTVKAYSAIADTGNFRSNTIFFPVKGREAKSDVVVMVPATNFYTRIVLPRLGKLYPDMKAKRVMPPMPWSLKMKETAYFIIRIPSSDRMRYAGLKAEFYRNRGLRGGRVSNAEMSRSGRWDGLVDVPHDGDYSFSVSAPGVGCEVHVDGGEAVSGQPLYLMEGLHELSVACKNVAGVQPALGLIWTHDNSSSEVPPDHFYNLGHMERKFFLPYLAGRARQAGFDWRQNGSIPLPVLGFGGDDPLMDLVALGADEIVAVGRRSVALFRNGREIKRSMLPSPRDYRARVGPDDTLYVYADGAGEMLLFDKTLDNDARRVLFRKHAVRDIAFDRDGFVYVLSGGPMGVVKYEKGKFDTPVLLIGSQVAFMNPEGVAVDSRGRIFVLDRERADATVFSPRGGFEREIAFPGIGWETDIASDSQGNIYMRDRKGYVVYDSGDHLLLRGASRNLFINDRGQPFDMCNVGKHSIGVHDHAAFEKDNQLLLFKKNSEQKGDRD